MVGVCHTNTVAQSIALCKGLGMEIRIETQTIDGGGTRLRAVTSTDPDNPLAGAICYSANSGWHLWSSQPGSPFADITCWAEADARTWIMWFAEQTLNAQRIS